MPNLAMDEQQFENEIADEMETALAKIEVEQDRAPVFRPRRKNKNRIANTKEFLKGFFADCDAVEREIETQIAAARTICDQRNREARAQCEEAIAKNDNEATTAVNELERELFQNRTVRESMQLASTNLNKAELPK